MIRTYDVAERARTVPPASNLALAQTGKVVIHVLLGRDGDAVAGSRAKAPILERLEHLAVDHRCQALNHNFLDNVAILIDRDFDDYISLQAPQFIGSNVRIRRDNRQRGTDFLSR